MTPILNHLGFRRCPGACPGTHPDSEPVHSGASVFGVGRPVRDLHQGQPGGGALDERLGLLGGRPGPGA